MKRGNVNTEAPLRELFEDFERAGICDFRPSEWERKALERRVAAGEVVCPMPGMYARAAYWEPLAREEKMLHVVRTEGILHPDWVFSHATAALVHGLDVSHDLLWPIRFCSDADSGHAPKHHVHGRGALNGVERAQGISVTTVPQTVVDCARTYPFAQALAIADSALHLGLATRDALADILADQPRRRGNKGARRVVSLADPRPESGGESMVRALMMELGLPGPELQVEVPDPENPGRAFRVDFMFRPKGELPVAFELDGLVKYRQIAAAEGKSAVRAMAEERQREAAITAHGIRVVRMGFVDAMKPAFLLRRLAVYGVVPSDGESRSCCRASG